MRWRSCYGATPPAQARAPVFYNITITAISVAVALIIGTIELIGVLVDQAGIDSGPLADIAGIPLDYAGYGIVALFALSWLVALAVWRFGRVEERWSTRLRDPAHPVPADGVVDVGS